MKMGEIMFKNIYLRYIFTLALALLCPHALAADAPKFELDKGWPKIPPNMKLGDVSSFAKIGRAHV